MKNNKLNIIFAVGLVLIAATARIVNAKLNIPNVVPIAAIGLFSGAIIKDKRSLAFLIPLLGQFLGDVYFQFFTNIPGFYNLPSQLFNYGALIAATALGVTMKQPKSLGTLGYVLGASGIFFIVSNFGYFVSGWNGYSFSGLIKTYTDAIPFFKYSLMGDIAGGVLLFGGYILAQNYLTNNAQKARA
jgi:hypothetical protein